MCSCLDLFFGRAQLFGIAVDLQPGDPQAVDAVPLDRPLPGEELLNRQGVAKARPLEANHADANGLDEIVAGLRPVVAAAPEQAAEVIRHGEVGIETNGFVVIDTSLLEIGFRSVRVNPAAPGERLGRTRIAADCFVERDERFVVALQALENAATASSAASTVRSTGS